MGSFTEPYSAAGNNAYQITEHYLQRVLVGNANDVRRRLRDVLDRLDYDLINEGEFEIEAHRNPRGWAGANASADVLDYQRKLVIKLKPLNENSTGASFIYIIKHPWLQHGEKAILTREAETIAELARIRATDKLCAVCGMESVGDSHFCRKCGAPLTGDESAIELLKMSGHVRAGYTSVIFSWGMLAATTVSLLAAFIALLSSGISIGPVAATFLILATVWALLGIYCALFGWRRLSKALKSERKKQGSLPPSSLKILPDIQNNNLADQAVFSVTDRTTELLNVPAKNRGENITNDLSKS